MTEKIKLVVFDCDGTLVDSQDSIVSAMSAAFGANSFEIPKAESVRRVVGLPLMAAIARLVPYAAPQTHAVLTEAYKDAFSKLRQNGHVLDPLYPGAMEAMDKLDDAGWLLGVATGKSRRGLLKTLEQHGIEDRFISLQTSDIGPGKPNPGMLFRIMSETGVEASMMVMIGDTTFDVEMARNAGVMVIGVSWGYHEGDELLDAGAHILVNDFADLPDAVESLMELKS